jgi:uncharacterized protein (DUF4415 family)
LKASKPRAVSKTDWKRVKALRDSDIDLTDVPEVHPAQARSGAVRVAGKVVPRGKRRLTMYLDAAVIEFFKARAGERGYQTLINEALKQAIERESIEDALRRVLREEMASYDNRSQKRRRE